jgi:TRAP-type mannitol/chloroaromatic compound transport system permease small subunit
VEEKNLKKFLHIIDNISEWTGRIFSWIIVVLTILVILEVILRRFLGSPTIWNFELTIQLYAFHFMIVSAYALLCKSHVVVDIVYAKMSKKTKAICDVVTYAIFFFPFLLIWLYQGTKYAAKSWAMHETSWSVFAPPLYPIKTVIPLVAFLLLIQGFATFVRQLHIVIKEKEL